MKKPIVVEKFADNGELSHYQLICANSGKLLWSELVDDYEYTSKEKLIDNACMYFRHDFWLMNDKEKDHLTKECKLWIVALSKAMQDNNNLTVIDRDASAR